MDVEANSRLVLYRHNMSFNLEVRTLLTILPELCPACHTFGYTNLPHLIDMLILFSRIRVVKVLGLISYASCRDPLIQSEPNKCQTLTY